MIREQRHARILSVLHRQGVVSVEELRRLMPEVAGVTIRRDLAQLDEAGALRRRHGGAALADVALVRGSGPLPGAEAVPMASDLDRLHAVILPPIFGRGAEILRREILRRGLPFIAESAEQPGGSYLGADNQAAGRELGLRAAEDLCGSHVSLLVIGHPDLANTRDRVAGFETGLTEGGLDTAVIRRVNGRGSYKPSLRAALDAFVVDETINVVFGVNDHAALAGLDAAERLGREVAVYSMGGESAGFMARLATPGPLRAVAALFPEVVGSLAIDMAMQGIIGQKVEAKITPHAVVTPENFAAYFTAEGGTWQLRDEVLEELVRPRSDLRTKLLRARHIGFLPHYPAHDWYRNMAAAMQRRCADYGATLVVAPPHHGIAAEVSRLRREIAAGAARLLRPDLVIALNEGQTNVFLAEEIGKRAAQSDPAVAGLTVVTNSFDVMQALEDRAEIKVVLTGGEPQKQDRCLVGPSLGAIFERLRPHLAFITVDGLTPGFGLSSLDERRALAAQRLIAAAGETIVLADSVALGSDANHCIAGLQAITQVLTDDSASPQDRQKFRDFGVDVLNPSETTADTGPVGGGPDQRRA